MTLIKSVKLRLTLWYALILTIFLSLFSFLMVIELSRYLYRDVDRMLSNEAGLLEKAVHLSATRRGFKEALQASHVVELVNRSTLMMRVIGPDHQVLLSNLKGWEENILFPNYERDSVFMEKGSSFQTIHFQGKPIRLYYRLVNKTQSLFIIQSATPLYEIRGILSRLVWTILFSIPGAVAAACVAGWFLARRFFRPVDSMIKESKKITAAYLKGRLPRTYREDELDRLAETLNEMIDRIESSTRAVQDFCSDISHELKTPLAIVRGEIDLALRRPRTPEALVETLRVIGSEVNELIRLVDDLMLLVRSDAKQLYFEKEKVSLPHLLTQVVQRFYESAETKKIKVTLSADEEADVEGDEIYLKRLFSNLLDNAVKFTPAGGEIQIRLHGEEKFASVEVSDTGPGIEMEIQSKVFSRFYRADQARSHEGAGLGLNIAKAISDAHGGTIGIHSFPGKGTKVTVRFPILLTAG